MLHDGPDQKVYGLSWCTRHPIGARLWPYLRYVNRVSIAVSQLLNTLANGEPNETLSSRIWRDLLAMHGRLPACGCWPLRAWPALLLAGCLEWFENEHCRAAYLHAKQRARVLTID